MEALKWTRKLLRLTVMLMVALAVDLWVCIVRKLPDNEADCPPVVLGQGEYVRTWPRGRHLDIEA